MRRSQLIIFYFTSNPDGHISIRILSYLSFLSFILNPLYYTKSTKGLYRTVLLSQRLSVLFFPIGNFVRHRNSFRIILFFLFSSNNSYSLYSPYPTIFTLCPFKVNICHVATPFLIILSVFPTSATKFPSHFKNYTLLIHKCKALFIHFLPISTYFVLSMSSSSLSVYFYQTKRKAPGFSHREHQNNRAAPKSAQFFIIEARPYFA